MGLQFFLKNFVVQVFTIFGVVKQVISTYRTCVHRAPEKALKKLPGMRAPTYGHACTTLRKRYWKRYKNLSRRSRAWGSEWLGPFCWTWKSETLLDSPRELSCIKLQKFKTDIFKKNRPRKNPCDLEKVNFWYWKFRSISTLLPLLPPSPPHFHPLHDHQWLSPLSLVSHRRERMRDSPSRSTVNVGGEVCLVFCR